MSKQTIRFGIVGLGSKDVNRVLRQAVSQGRLGQLVSGSAYVKWFRPQAYYDATDARRTLALAGGGALINQGIHNVDLLLWLMGDPL